MTQNSMLSAISENLITHQDEARTQLNVEDIKDIEARLETASNLTLPLEEELKILHQMTEFELGRFLLKNGGISGYWTAYWLIHGPAQNLDHPLEDWLINRAPAFMASRERYQIFAHHIQNRVKPGMKLASIPCGLMDDLLRLDYSSVPEVQLFGFDLDEESIALAKGNAKAHGKSESSHIEKRDAWNLQRENEFDIITSNGLNFYESDDAKVVALYKEFYKALRKGGILVTSFLTPSPQLDSNSTWKNFNPADVQKQKAVFMDIMNARWSAMRPEGLTRTQLEEAGFQIVEIIYDSQGIFPTVIAQK
ncbi:Methyltransferase domain protein [Candidatus Bealeia paramacronuclearis]|uniref:Methyltransferase domain protein n=1 Tax=Candidatus Bealeia paramacronuclearis TaxID=1921001 RepID=A0ABZ2C1M7_9PROT|nr:Methyltransferase domain protein [Candidatus Bealeia paramacronuclearis]